MFGEAAVEDRDEDQGNDGGDTQTPGHRNAQAAPHLGAFTGAQGHGQHAQDGGEGGHEDRTQTAAGSSNRGFAYTHAPFLAQDGVVDEHDTVLNHDTQQDDDTHHAHHADGQVVDHVPQRHAGKGKRDREHDDERPHEGLELGSHHHVYQDNDKGHQQEQGAEHFLLLFVVAADGIGQFLRQRAGFQNLVHGIHGLGQSRSAGHQAGCRNIPFAVLALNSGRHLGLYHPAQVADPDGLAGRVIDQDVLDVVHALAELRRIADTDVVLVAVFAVEGTHRAAHGGRYGSGGGGGRQAVQGQFFAVEVYLVLGRIIVTAQQDLREFAAGHHLLAIDLGCLLGFIEVVAVDFQHHTRGTAHAHATLGHVGLLELGEEAKVGADDIGNLGGGAEGNTLLAGQRLTLGGRVHVDVEGDDVGAVGAHVGPGVVGVGLAKVVAHDLDLGDIGADLLVDGGRHFAGDVLRRADGQLGRYAHAALVLRGEELGLHAGSVDGQYHHKHHEGQQQHQLLVVHAPGDEAGIAGRKTVQELIDGCKQEIVELAGFAARREQQGAQHGHQGESRRGGHDHDDAHNPAQLPEHDTRHAIDHGKRQEHAQHGEGGCNNGNTHLGGAVHGGFLGFLSTLDVGSHILQYHNGIVHHHTHGNGQGAHGDDIQGVTRKEQVHQGCQQGDGDGQHHDEGPPPPAQEQEHHQHHHQEGDEDGLEQGADGIEDVGRRVYHRIDLDVAGKVGLDLLERLLHILDHIHRIVSRLLLDDNLGAAGTVGVGLLGFFLHAVLYAGHVPQIDGSAAPVAHNNVHELLGIGEFLLDAQRVGVGADIDAA